jgi:hypothetical protein
VGQLDRNVRPPHVFIEVELDGSSTHMTDTLWKCEQLRAGQIYNTLMFNTREEAEKFKAHMNRMEPDMFCRIEPVPVNMVWN